MLCSSCIHMIVFTIAQLYLKKLSKIAVFMGFRMVLAVLTNRGYRKQFFPSIFQSF